MSDEIEKLKVELEQTRAAWGFSMLMVRHYLYWSREEPGTPADRLKQLQIRLEHFANVDDENRSAKEEIIKQLHLDIAKKMEPQLDELRAKVRDLPKQIETAKSEIEKQAQSKIDTAIKAERKASQKAVKAIQEQAMKDPDRHRIVVALQMMLTAHSLASDPPERLPKEQVAEFAADATSLAIDLMRGLLGECGEVMPSWAVESRDRSNQIAERWQLRFVGEIRKLERIAKLAELIHHCYEVEPMREFLRESGWEILPDGYCSHPEHAPPSGMHPENALSLEMQFAIEALERTGGQPTDE